MMIRSSFILAVTAAAEPVIAVIKVDCCCGGGTNAYNEGTGR